MRNYFPRKFDSPTMVGNAVSPCNSKRPSFDGVLDQFETAPAISYSNKLLKASLASSRIMRCYDSSDTDEDNFRVKATSDEFGTPTDHVNSSSQNPGDWSTGSATVGLLVNQSNPGTYDAQQATESLQPAYGLSSPTFDGADDYLVASSPPEIEKTTPFTVAWVSRSTAAGASAFQYIWNLKNSHSPTNGDFRCSVNTHASYSTMFFGGSDGTNWLILRAASSPMVKNDSQLRYGIFRFDGVSSTTLSSYDFMVDGSDVVLSSVAAVSAHDAGGLAIGGVGIATTSMPGTIPCFFFWPTTNVTGDDLTLLQAHLASYTP